MPNKVYECWIKPPNENWFNYTSEVDNQYYAKTKLANDDDWRNFPAGYSYQKHFERKDYISLGYKMQWRPKRDKEWRQREKARLSRTNRKDMYELLPKEWDELAPITDHFAHISVDRDETQSDLIAYTLSEQKGEEDVQTKIKAGKYLKKYYPDLTNEAIRYYSEAVQSMTCALKITDDPNEAAEVYQNGPDSCMKRDKSHFGYPKELRDQGIHHPVAAYFAGDIKLAYLGDKSYPSARCLVWPEKKLYGRIYGAIQRMKQTLERLGYKDSYAGGDNYVFVGARMKLIFIDENNIVWPYRDGMASCYMKKGDSHCYNGPKSSLEISHDWKSLDICHGEGGRSTFIDPFVVYCAVSRRKIDDKTLKDERLVGYVYENTPALITEMLKRGYELLDGEKYWIPSSHVIWFLDREGNRTKKRLLSERGWVSNGVRKDGHYEYFHPNDAFTLHDGEYAHVTQNVLEYRGKYYRDLAQIFYHHPSLDPGRVMFDMPLNEKQNKNVVRYLYLHKPKAIACSGFLGYELQNYYSKEYGL